MMTNPEPGVVEKYGGTVTAEGNPVQFRLDFRLVFKKAYHKDVLIRQFEENCEKDPNDLASWQQLATAYYLQNELEYSVEAYEVCPVPPVGTGVRDDRRWWHALCGCGGSIACDWTRRTRPTI
jgi:hypothetical protein